MDNKITAKRLYQVNKYIFVTNLVLYLFVSPGMAFQLILGIIQLITATIFTTRFAKTKFKKIMLITYWCSVIAYSFVMTKRLPMFTATGYLIYFATPMMIATFFLYICYNFNLKKNDTPRIT